MAGEKVDQSNKAQQPQVWWMFGTFVICLPVVVFGFVCGLGAAGVISLAWLVAMPSLDLLFVMGSFTALGLVAYTAATMSLNEEKRLDKPLQWSMLLAARLGLVLEPATTLVLIALMPLSWLVFAPLALPLAFALLQGGLLHWFWNYLATRPSAWQSTRQFALMMGANPQAKNWQGESVLDCAMNKNQIELSLSLQAMGVPPKPTPDDQSKYRPEDQFYRAVKDGNISAARDAKGSIGVLAQPACVSRALHDVVRQVDVSTAMAQWLLSQDANPLEPFHPDADPLQSATSAFAVAIHKGFNPLVNTFTAHLSKKSVLVPLPLFELALSCLHDNTCLLIANSYVQTGTDLSRLDLSTARARGLSGTIANIKLQIEHARQPDAAVNVGGTPLGLNHMHANPPAGQGVVAPDGIVLDTLPF